MRDLRGLIALAGLSVLSTPAFAEPLRVDYGSFYSHVRKIDKDETQALQFAFGLKHIHQNRLCRITDAYIHTEKKQIPVSLDPRYRFTVPKEKALKLAKAEVVLELDDAVNQCDMSVQLETRPEYLKTSYRKADLELILANYQAFFDNMGSFLSFMMPSAVGLKIELAENSTQEAVKLNVRVKDGLLILDEKWLSEHNGFTLSQAPLRILALMDNES